MSPDNRLISSENSKEEILQQALLELVDIPTEQDIEGIANLSHIPYQLQDNPGIVQISSPTYGTYSASLPGVHGDFQNHFPVILRAQGRDKIIPYRASHEGLLNIVHPLWSTYRRLADIQRIDIYSKFQASDLPSTAPYKRVTFPIGDTYRIPHPSKTVGRNAHNVAMFSVVRDRLNLNAFNLNGYQLSPQEEQMEEIHFLRKGEPFSLCFRPEGLSYRAENAYELLGHSEIPYMFHEN